MKESEFIKRRAGLWRSYETMLRKGNTPPEELMAGYAQITDDLAYARTHYPNRSVRAYLNQLMVEAQRRINAQRQRSRLDVQHFWRVELPATLYKTRHSLLLACGLFVLFFAIGAVSVVHQPEFARSILGEGYVAMTEANIQQGDPMAVYKKARETDMLIGIALNNIRVAFLAFLGGLLAGLGSFTVLFYNGVMVGVFQFFFYQHGLLKSSALTLWMHGVPEITAIVLSAGAGFELARAWLFPGALPRGASLRLRGRRAVYLMVALVPVILWAAFIESFFTRYTGLPDALRAGFILLSLAGILLYGVVLPRRLVRRGELPPDPSMPDRAPVEVDAFSLRRPQSSASLWVESLRMVFAGGKRQWGPLLGASLCACLGVAWIARNSSVSLGVGQGLSLEWLIARAWSVTVLMVLLVVSCWAYLVLHANAAVMQRAREEGALDPPAGGAGRGSRWALPGYGPFLGLSAVLLLLVSLYGPEALLLLPVVLFWFSHSALHQHDPFLGWKQVWRVWRPGFGAWLSPHLALLLLAPLIALGIGFGSFGLQQWRLLLWNLPPEWRNGGLLVGLLAGFAVFLVGVLLLLMAYLNALLSVVLREKTHGHSLWQEMENRFPQKESAT